MMTIQGSRRIAFYKRLGLIAPLIKALKHKNKWIRYHAVLALADMGNQKALPALQRMMEDDRPGYWMEDVEGTVNDLAPHYPGRDDIYDAIETYNRDWERTLRASAENAIARIEARCAKRKRS